MEFASRTAPKLESEPIGADPFESYQQILPQSVHSRNSASQRTMNKQDSDRNDIDNSLTRRKFIGTAALSSAALLAGGLTSLVTRSVSAEGDFQFVEATIPELQDAIASGQLTSAHLVRGYLERIQSLNPLLHSVIQTNPVAVCIAQEL